MTLSFTPNHRDALLDAASEGVAFDGLLVEHTDEGYRFEVAETTGSALDEEGLAEIAERASDYVANWYYWTHVVDATSAGRAFLRWIERAESAVDSETEEWSVPQRHERLTDGVDREWGQLRITASLLDDGRRHYALRHVADEAGVGESDQSLTPLAGPRELAERTTTDQHGRYRPLKTAPTLPPGWRLEDMDWSGLLEAVGEVYPAAVENWHRERQGALDVDHFRETADRQTGIYDVVDELPREALEWVAEACCVDSQCLKRREWDEAPDDELDVPRGEGEFPCREPCSLLIAAAREWTKLEREETRTYEVELTPSEKAQLDDLVDAVADGRVDDVREADLGEGANRYRIRYLRAKRFEDGRFPASERTGEPTDTDSEGAGRAWWWPF